jgi:pimeloyl-ACP methyl ester carboxylesterase
MTQDYSHLPRILCLHGGGTSKVIFQFQARRLIRALRPHFRLVFVDAPFESAPGPGVLPVFEGAGPYYEWLTKDDEGEEQVRSLLQRKLHEDDGAPVVGVLGFSQGTRIGSGLLHEQEQNGAFAPSLCFGVFLNGNYPPLRQRSNPSTLLPSISEFTLHESAKEWKEAHEGIIHLPSVHVLGRQDDILPRGQLLARCFDPATATIFEFDNGHYLPTRDDDTQKIADEIVRIYRAEQEKKNSK